jgi:hypothetical protein
VPSFTQDCSLPTATTPACVPLIKAASTPATASAGVVDENRMASQLGCGMSGWRSCPESQRADGTLDCCSGSNTGNGESTRQKERKAARLSPQVAGFLPLLR